MKTNHIFIIVIVVLLAAAYFMFFHNKNGGFTKNLPQGPSGGSNINRYTGEPLKQLRSGRQITDSMVMAYIPKIRAYNLWYNAVLKNKKGYETIDEALYNVAAYSIWSEDYKDGLTPEERREYEAQGY